MPKKCYICNPGENLILLEDLHVCKEHVYTEPKKLKGKLIESTYFNELEVCNEKA